MPQRHIFLRIETGEIAKDAEDYYAVAKSRWDELAAVLGDPKAPFYKRVVSVDNIECDGTYELCGTVFEILLELTSETGVPDISKPGVAKAITPLFANSKVVTKRVVPLPDASWGPPAPEPTANTLIFSE